MAVMRRTMVVRRTKPRQRGRRALAAATPLLVGTAGLVFWRRRAGGRGERIEQLMTPNPRTVTEETPVVEAARIMRDEDVGSLPVVADNRVVGIVSDRDIAMRVVAEGRDPQAVAIGDVMSRDLVLVRPEQHLDEALRLMARHQLRRLPVVEEGDRLVGILAQADVALEGGDRETGETVERISERTAAPRT